MARSYYVCEHGTKTKPCCSSCRTKYINDSRTSRIKKYLAKINLCDTCLKYDVSCPIEPSEAVKACIEYRKNKD